MKSIDRALQPSRLEYDFPGERQPVRYVVLFPAVDGGFTAHGVFDEMAKAIEYEKTVNADGKIVTLYDPNWGK